VKPPPMTVELPPEQIEAIAERVFEHVAALVATSPSPELIDAAELARRLGRKRAFVYEHATILGAHRVGEGPRPRLLFPWPEALERMTARSTGERSQERASGASKPKRHPGSSRSMGTGVTLLPIRG
jgi:hypothetical protein